MSDATAFSLPEDLTVIEDAELASLAEAARAEGVALSSAETFSTADADRLEYLAASMASINDQVAANATAVAELAARHAAAAAAFAVVDPEVVAEAPVVEAELAAVEPAAEEEPVVAAVKPNARQIVAHAPKTQHVPADITPAAPSVIVAAAADVPGLATGSVMENGLDGLVAALGGRWDAYRGANQTKGTRMQHGLATIKVPFAEGLVADGTNDQAVMRHAVDQSRLPGGSLIAAGGWCAPSETLYDVCSAGEVTGTFSLPEIGASRGGIRYTRALDYSTIFAQIQALTLCATEAQLIETPPLEKDCIEVDCPDFTEVRMDACWLCVKTALLQNRAFPEYVREFLRTAVVAHQNLMDTRTINAVVTLLGAATVIPATFGTIPQLLAAIDLEATDFRYKHSIDKNSVLEVVLPEWIVPALRDDYARRQFNATGVDLTTPQVNAWFATRNVSVQWVRNWQSSGFGQVANATAYPQTAQFMLYQAGSFVRLREDIIRVDSLSDSALLTTNRQLGLFVEEGWAVAPMCKSGRLVTFSVCNSGATGGPIASTPGAFTCGQA